MFAHFAARFLTLLERLAEIVPLRRVENSSRSFGYASTGRLATRAVAGSRLFGMFDVRHGVRFGHQLARVKATLLLARQRRVELSVPHSRSVMQAERWQQLMPMNWMMMMVLMRLMVHMRRHECLIAQRLIGAGAGRRQRRWRARKRRTRLDKHSLSAENGVQVFLIVIFTVNALDSVHVLVAFLQQLVTQQTLETVQMVIHQWTFRLTCRRATAAAYQRCRRRSCGRVRGRRRARARRVDSHYKLVRIYQLHTCVTSRTVISFFLKLKQSLLYFTLESLKFVKFSSLLVIQ